MHFLISAIVLLALAPPDPSTVMLTAPGRSKAVSSAEGGALLSIPDVVGALGGNARAQPGASVAVEISGHRIVAADGIATAAFDDRVVILAHPTRAFDGVLYAPWEFFARTVFPAVGLAAEYDRPGHKIHAHTAAAPGIDASAATVDGVTQIVFRVGKPVTFTASPAAQTYTLKWSEALVPAAPDRSFDDPMVEKVTFGSDTATLVLREKGLLATAYVLKDPDRIVVEVSRAGRPVPTPGAPPAAPSLGPAIRTVVIDAGHGGDETGAIGPGNIAEKDVTLDIAERVASVLGKSPSVRPVLTRTGDTLVALDERAAIANHEKAAIFLSIHANSSRAAGAHGSETYYLSLAASDKLSDAVARDENSAGAPRETGASGPDAPPDLDFILWDMAQSAHLNESAKLAEAVQDQLNGLLHTENRGIKQAPFRVLVGATMPAVLVETAFLSNPEEARELASPEFRQSVADAIARAVIAYLASHPIPPATSP